MPYFWAAYKLKAFDGLADEFKEELTSEEFSYLLNKFIGENSLTPFSFFGDVNGVNRIIGIGLFDCKGRILETTDILWFPWAGDRLILECYVNFVNSIRKKKVNDTNNSYLILEFAREKDKKFFDKVCSYGIMRRVGTSYEVYPDEKCCIYESRSIKNDE